MRNITIANSLNNKTIEPYFYLKIHNEISVSVNFFDDESNGQRRMSVGMELLGGAGCRMIDCSSTKKCYLLCA